MSTSSKKIMFIFFWLHMKWRIVCQASHMLGKFLFLTGKAWFVIYHSWPYAKGLQRKKCKSVCKVYLIKFIVRVQNAGSKYQDFVPYNIWKKKHDAIIGEINSNTFNLLFINTDMVRIIRIEWDTTRKVKANYLAMKNSS